MSSPQDEFPTIAIGDVDVRLLPFSITGIDDGAVISVAMMKFNVIPGDEDYLTVDWSDDTKTALSLPFGGDGGYDLETLGLGLYYPCWRVVDGTNVRTGVSYIALQVVSGAVV